MMVWKIKAQYPGAGWWLQSDTEPDWIEVTKGGKVLHRLVITKPKNPVDTHRDGENMLRPIYREHLQNFTYEEVLTKEQRAERRGDRDYYLLLDTIMDGMNRKEEDPIRGKLCNYGEIKDKTGFGQSKLKDLMGRAQAEGVTVYTKEGRMSFFALSEDGISAHNRLYEQLEEVKE